MGLFDKLTGTKHPDDGVAPRPAEEVRTALLGLNRPDVPYIIRSGAAEGADLVAEWRMAEPAWQAIFIESQLTRAVRIRMRLVQETHAVRALEEGWEVTRVGNPPKLKISGAYSRGPDRTVSRHYTVERGESGSLEATETFRFNGADLRNPLQDAVLKSGWTWRGVVFGKL
ncbi:MULTISPECIES: hypothetical protein [Streptomyces]|uniref:DUF4178 domain-containing protein n=1 Tax=Streptomyces dengpaensis TaxID=2049881 RepID=A0ABN5HYJ1_9ACTN|nr:MULTISPECIES: hypothetical protein [Streptomyces]AVH56163.1 hypothetical protein C4B68_10695 [Streptomyces dengpaensis]PIB07121.1 hypothetical protein B1C81_20570 [Streptomyces sp. HG99]